MNEQMSKEWMSRESPDKVTNSWNLRETGQTEGSYG